MRRLLRRFLGVFHSLDFSRFLICDTEFSGLSCGIEYVTVVIYPGSNLISPGLNNQVDF